MDFEEAYAADGDRGRTHEYREPITMTFEPNECSPTSSPPPRQSSRLRALAESNNALLSNVQQQHHQQNHHHQRQQSAPDLYAEARTPSPASRARHRSQDMPFTGDGRGSRRQDDNSPGKFGGWLNAPSVGEGSGNGSSGGIVVSPDTTPTPKSATPSRLGFFGWLTTPSPSTSTNPNITITPSHNDANDPSTSTSTGRATADELLNLDVDAALYPSPADRDVFSPAAYKNLQQNASGLLRRMQDAYRARTIAYKEVVAEREAQREEADETELRVRSLRAQLESMAEKAQEQELAMRRLVAELRFERSAREEERQEERKERARLEREVEGFRRREMEVGMGGEKDGDGGLAEGPLITEDLCVDEEHERKRWRKSDGTVRSDLSIDTDAESAESESIFSRSRSPTAMTSATESEVNAELLSVRTPPVSVSQGQKKVATTTPQLTAFQRLVKGISGDGANAGAGVDGCSNCRGQDSSVAWDTVSLLRDENRGLKHRVAELEVVVDGALDVVNGIGLS
ncbi:uncharacterized protein F4807DRAFT_267784 [Annulohypoxylon truncatum]|uniref:uncharacterized protein n=1 Tax=Annulohypoxylon truncatum TaxID=327061 RepID=UPI0020076311|nr:uncharacterized protein F4807DRAFT_267784 [Annulohypoxylon truncatum]KAI1213489.1 hypothetical protein F4807DRAFT_267784 [Annulohypoxylon truncatum]